MSSSISSTSLIIWWASSIKCGTFLIMHPCITAGISELLLSPHLSLYHDLFYSSLKCSGVDWYAGTRLVMWRAVMISYLAFANCSKAGIVQIIKRVTDWSYDIVSGFRKPFQVNHVPGSPKSFLYIYIFMYSYIWFSYYSSNMSIFI